MVVPPRPDRQEPFSDHDGRDRAYEIVCAAACRVKHTKLPSSLSVRTSALLYSLTLSDLMHGYQFATPRAILHIGWYWTIHHVARHRYIAHPPLTLQMLLPTSTRCAAVDTRGRG